MSIIFECPNCRKTYETGEHLAGKGMRCRDCQAVIRVPDLAAPAPPAAPRRPVGPPAAPAASRPTPARPAPTFAPPDDDDDDLPYAVAEIDDEEDEPPPRPAPAPAVAPRPVPAARPPQAGGRPAPLPRMSFDPSPAPAAGAPATGAPAAPAGTGTSPARKEPRARERREESERGDAGQMVKLGAAGLFALVALLAVARVFLMGSGGGAEEDQTIILDAGPDFGVASAPRPAPSPPTEAPALAPAAREDYPSGVPSLTRSAGPAGLVAFPEVGPGFEVEPGVTWQRVRLMPSRQSIGNPPPGSLMTLWLYLPAGHHDAASLPCILIAPAGSTLVTGNGWYEPGAPPSAPSDPPRGDEGRHPEHLPYVRAGFAVLGYELDGAVPENFTEGQFVSGVRRFLAARAGLDNAHAAMEFLKARVPQVDPNRIYAAGHSSAATTALLVAANEPGIAGCVAFAPCVDVMGRFQRATGDVEATIRDLERGVPGARALFTTYAPAENLARLSCPVFLLHAEDDANVPIADSRLVVERCRPGQVAMVNVAAGGHYDPMIRGGIDRAIQWLKEQGARPVPPGAPAGPAPAGGQMEAIPGF